MIRQSILSILLAAAAISAHAALDLVDITQSITTVPEPGNLAKLLAGFALMGLIAFRRTR